MRFINYSVFQFILKILTEAGGFYYIDLIRGMKALTQI